MNTKVDQIADDIFRLSTYKPGLNGQDGVIFNLVLIDADESLLYHCGQRWLFPLAIEAVARIVDVKRVRWLSFSHMEADECGSMNRWLAAAPNAMVAHGVVGGKLWVDDQADRPPRRLHDDEVMDLGGKRVRFLATPHVPHNPDAGLRGYRVEPQVPCGGYRIDFVVEGNEGRRLAIECDGDRFHGPGQWSDDMARQRVLERAGWTFWRCFASSFVRRREAVVGDLLQTLERLGIEPLGAESVDNTVWVYSKEVDPYGVEEEQEVA